MIVSSCGLICDECPYFGKPCTGCRDVKGQTFWAKEMMPNRTCALYDCAVNVRHLHDCGGCAELPCARFVELKDPNVSEEEHKAGLVRRVAALKKT
jgi:hypothetical protein